MTEPASDLEDPLTELANWLEADDPDTWDYTQDSAGRTLLRAVETLVGDWVEDEIVSPIQADGVIFLDRRSPEQKAYLLRLLALATFERALKFQIALHVAVSLDRDVSWNAMAKALGVSRQGLHRKYHSLVKEIRSSTGEEVVDMASRFGSLPQPE